MSGSNGEENATLRKELGVFGLSDTEIDTYLALLSRGEATTRTVADDADVTQRAVYDIVERLEQRGFVRVKDHASPTTIRALPPDEAIGNLSSKLESIIPVLEERFNATSKQAPEIKMIKSRDTALKHIRSAISDAEHEALIAIPEHVFTEIESELRDAVDRDVLVFLLLGEMKRGETLDQVAGVADAVRYWNASLPFVYGIDDESAMIGDPEILKNPHTGEDAVTVSQRHLTGSILGMYLGAYWPTCTELYVTEPDPLPKTFDWFRHGVFQALLHHRGGTDLCADIITVDGEEFSGRVTEVRQAFVEPRTNDYTLETSLFLETEDDEVSFGGPGAFIEDYEAEAVTLRTDS